MSAPQPEYFAAAMKLVEALESQNIPYLIGGSVASGIHGIPRSTHDVDLVVEMAAHHAEPFVQALASRFYADLRAIQEAIRTRRAFNLIYLETMVKLDVFVAKEEPFARSQMARRLRLDLVKDSGQSAYVSSPEDTILAKLAWYRAGGEVSSSQWNDVLGVMKVQGAALDREYISQWASNLGLTDLIGKALWESGLESRPPA